MEEFKFKAFTVIPVYNCGLLIQISEFKSISSKLFIKPCAFVELLADSMNKNINVNNIFLFVVFTFKILIFVRC